MDQLPHHHQHQEIDMEHLPANDTFIPVADTFKLLSDPIRLKLFWILCHHELCVLNLAATVNMSSPAIAHHLRKLKDNQLLVSRKVGKEVYYHAANTPIVQALHPMMEVMMDIHCPNEK